MMNISTILCPIDFSTQSQQALRWAAALARRHRSRLVVVTAVDPLLAQAAKVRLGLDLAKSETEPELREFVKAVLPDEWPRLEPGFEGLIEEAEGAIPVGRDAFAEWRKEWLDLVAGLKLEVVAAIAAG